MRRIQTPFAAHLALEQVLQAAHQRSAFQHRRPQPLDISKRAHHPLSITNFRVQLHVCRHDLSQRNDLTVGHFVEQLAIADLCRVVRDPNGLGVLRPSLVHLIVVRGRASATGVAPLGIDHAFELLERQLGTPEATASEDGRFTIKDVIELLTDKLVRRHPYVFAGAALPEDPAAALKQRAQLKANENVDGEAKSALGNVPKAMPALARAQSISRRAAHLGFEWPNIEAVWGKVEEEMRELKQAAAAGDKIRTGEEFGDLLFTMVNVARFLDLESEEVLAQTVDRFTRRFHHIERRLREANKDFDQSSLEELDRFWEEAKKIEAREKSPT